MTILLTNPSTLQATVSLHGKTKVEKTQTAPYFLEQDIEGTNADSGCSWSQLCEKMTEIVSLVSYDLIASDQVWEELTIAQDIITIVDNIRKAFKANSQFDLRLVFVEF